MTPLEILVSARNLLATRGWTQDEPEDSQGRRCIVGAVHAIASHLIGSRTMDTTFALLSHAIHRRKCPHYSCIAVWNDTPGRTKRQVLNAMNRAIALAKAEAAIGRARAQRKPERRVMEIA